MYNLTHILLTGLMEALVIPQFTVFVMLVFPANPRQSLITWYKTHTTPQSSLHTLTFCEEPDLLAAIVT